MSILLLVTLILYVIGLVITITAWRQKRHDLSVMAISTVAVGFITHTTALIWRANIVGRLPLTGHVAEVFAFLSWALVLYYLITFLRYRTQALTAFILPLVVPFILIANVFPADRSPQEQFAGLADSWLFLFHASLLMFSYAAFFVTFAAGVMYLVQERELKLKRFGAFFFQLPSLKTCDEISYRSLAVGFVLLTFGMASGIFLNGKRDGLFWRNDPKEIIALMTWMLYLALIHYRLLAGWRGHRTAVLSIIGFGLIIFSLVGARFLGGYHVFG